MLLVFSCSSSKGTINNFDSIKRHLASAAEYKVLRISLNENDLKVYKNKKRRKEYKFEDALISLSGHGLIKLKHIKTRGQNCQKAPRRCFSVKFNEKLEVDFFGKKSKLDSFNLISLWEDDHYVNSKLGFQALASLGFAQMNNVYVELILNDETQGLYLLTEKPYDAINRIENTPFITRRGYFERAETKRYYKDQAHVNLQGKVMDQKAYEKAFRAIYSKVVDKSDWGFFYKQLKGQKLWDKLNQILDVEEYMTWLAINSIFMNGDYTDEVYFYAQPQIENTQQIRFRIMPWDLDDLFKGTHRLGILHDINFTDKIKLKNSYLYSLEDEMDEMIHDRPFLNQKYKEILRNLLENKVTDQFVNQLFLRVEKDISPYLENAYLLNKSQLDRDREKKPYTKIAVLQALKGKKELLKNRVTFLLNKLNEKKKPKIRKPRRKAYKSHRRF